MVEIYIRKGVVSIWVLLTRSGHWRETVWHGCRHTEDGNPFLALLGKRLSNASQEASHVAFVPFLVGLTCQRQQEASGNSNSPGYPTTVAVLGQTGASGLH